MTRPFHIVLLAALCGTICWSCAKRADENARIWYEQGKQLREQGKPAEAMEVFLKAVHSGTTDEALLGRIYSNMANICRQADNHPKAFAVYTVSAEHFLASGDSLAYAYALNNMAWEQAAMSHKDSALFLIAEALRSYPRSPLTDKIIETQAAACFFVQDYDSVLFYSTPPADDYLLMLRAQAFSFLQMDDSATVYAQLLLPRTTNLFYLDDLYYILTHNNPQAGIADVRDLSSERADVQQLIKQRHGQLLLAVQLLDSDSTDGKTPMMLLLVLVIAFICVILGFTAWLIHHQRRLLRLEQSAHRQARKQQLEQTIFFLREADDLRAELAWNDYAAFCRQTNNLFHGLTANLQQQSLNEQDIRICILVLIGLPHRQIADLLNCSPKSIGKLKDITARKLHVRGGQLHTKLESLAIN